MAKGYTVTQSQLDRVYVKIEELDRDKQNASMGEMFKLESEIAAIEQVLNILNLPRKRRSS